MQLKPNQLKWVSFGLGSIFGAAGTSAITFKIAAKLLEVGQGRYRQNLKILETSYIRLYDLSQDPMTTEEVLQKALEEEKRYFDIVNNQPILPEFEEILPKFLRRNK